MAEKNLVNLIAEIRETLGDDASAVRPDRAPVSSESWLRGAIIA